MPASLVTGDEPGHVYCGCRAGSRFGWRLGRDVRRRARVRSHRPRTRWCGTPAARQDGGRSAAPTRLRQRRSGSAKGTDRPVDAPTKFRP